MTDTIDLNADLGESFGAWQMGDDEAMLDIVSSANIACGFHAGDPVVMQQTLQHCKRKGVNAGAHPGFDDLRGFGRRRLLDPDAGLLRASIQYQVGALQGLAKPLNLSISHVKMHGALANMASEDAGMAAICLAAIRDLDPLMPVIAIASTALQTEAQNLGLPVLREVYADRAYNADGTLVSRAVEGAVIHDPAVAADRVLRMLETCRVQTLCGREIPVQADTVCVHGDNPGSVAMADQLRTQLERNGVRVAGF